MRRLVIVCSLIASILASIVCSPAHSTVHAASAPNACANAGTPENAVVHFYWALETQQYTAAYRCLGPEFQTAGSPAYFAQGYATTVSTKLLIADRQPDGSVYVDLHALDRKSGNLIDGTFRGTWTIGSSLTLTHAAIKEIRALPSTRAVTPTVQDIFAFDKQIVAAHASADVTGGGDADAIYVTQDATTRHIWVFDQGVLIFAETIPDVQSIVAHVAAHTLSVNTTAGGQLWQWSTFGFVLVPVAAASHATPSRALPNPKVGGVFATQVNLTTSDVTTPWKQFADAVKGTLDNRFWTMETPEGNYILESEISCPGVEEAKTFYTAQMNKRVSVGVWKRGDTSNYKIIHGVEWSMVFPLNPRAFEDQFIYTAHSCAGILSLVANTRDLSTSAGEAYNSRMFYTERLEGRFAAAFGVHENLGSD